MTLSTDAPFTSPFSQANLARMQKGYPPRAPFSETVKNRRSYEMRHIVPTSEGGALYDLDNLRILTPKQCISLYGDPQ
ncbi:hypothetical protein [Pseudomonas sp. 2835]|uniref:hypothetical protein n=1 Tax=Pseudomonas sp. 2835 TaxID=3156451 RepID=UPI003D236220